MFLQNACSCYELFLFQFLQKKIMSNFTDIEMHNQNTRKISEKTRMNLTSCSKDVLLYPAQQMSFVVCGVCVSFSLVENFWSS